MSKEGQIVSCGEGNILQIIFFPFIYLRKRIKQRSSFRSLFSPSAMCGPQTWQQLP